MAAVATIEVRGGSQLTDAQAERLAWKLRLTRYGAWRGKVLAVGKAQVKVRLTARGLYRSDLGSWLETVANNILRERKHWDAIYRAKLY